MVVSTPFHEAEALLECLLATSHEFVFVFSLEQACEGKSSACLRYVNPRFEQVLGYTVSELSQENHFDWFSKFIIGGQALQETLQAADRSLSPDAQERMVVFKTRDGRQFSAELRLTPIPQSGASRQWVGICAYNPEHHKVQSELSKTMRLLTSIIEHLPTPLFIKKAQDLSFVIFNKANEELLGFSNEYLEGKTDHDLFPQEQADFFTSIDRQVLASGRIYDIPEEEITTHTGELRVLHTRKVAVPDENGEPVFLLGICDDITERKRAQDALKKAYDNLESEVERRVFELKQTNIALAREIQERSQVERSLETMQKYLHHIVNRLPIALFALDKKGVCIMSEGSALEIMGLTPGQLVGVDVIALYSSNEAYSAAIKRGLSGDRFTNITEFNDLILETHWVPNLTEEGALDGCYGVTYNITQFKQTERALLKIQDELESKVEERTSELSQANRQLLALDQMRRNMVSTLTHDLRTPLIAQGRVLSLLGAEEDIRRNKKISDIILGFQRNNEDLLKMVNNLLETYELEDGRVKLMAEPVKLPVIIANCFDELAPLALSKNIALLNQVRLEAGIDQGRKGKELPTIMADPLLMKRLFNNLLGNAIANIPPNSQITVQASTEGDEAVCLRIFDNGQGIAEDLLPHLFTRQFSGRITKRKIGSGLGLYICKMIVDLHGGIIEVSTKNERLRHGPHVNDIEAHGTLFHIRLPLYQAPSIQGKADSSSKN